MSRRLIYVVLAVVVGAIVYVVFLRDRGGDGAAPDGPAATGGTGGTASTGGPAVAVPRPRQPSAGTVATPDPAAGTADGPRTYVTDTGNVVRDHRTGVAEPIAVPAPLPPGDRTMNPQLSGALYQQLAPIVRKCGVDAPGDGRGDDPVAHVTLTLDIVDGKLTTTDATAVTSDVPGPAGAQIAACVRDRAAALTVAANGEPDRTGYIVQYPIRLRR